MTPDFFSWQNLMPKKMVQRLPGVKALALEGFRSGFYVIPSSVYKNKIAQRLNILPPFDIGDAKDSLSYA
jgi:hypothetical protein